MIHEVQPFEGARGLIEDLKSRGCKVVLASSAQPEDIAHYLDLLDARELADGWTDSSSVERTKPAPDLVEAALEIAGGGHGRHDRRLDLGLSRRRRPRVDDDLRAHGRLRRRRAARGGRDRVFDSIAELRERLSETPFG